MMASTKWMQFHSKPKREVPWSVLELCLQLKLASTRSAARKLNGLWWRKRNLKRNIAKRALSHCRRTAPCHQDNDYNIPSNSDKYSFRSESTFGSYRVAMNPYLCGFLSWRSCFIFLWMVLLHGLVLHVPTIRVCTCKLDTLYIEKSCSIGRLVPFAHAHFEYIRS